MTALMALFTVTSPVLATSFPCPIPLKLNPALEGLHVELRDGSNVIGTSVSNAAGEISFDIGNIAACYEWRDGARVVKQYEAVILECEGVSGCSKMVGFVANPPEMWDVSVVPITTTTTVPPFNWSDFSVERILEWLAGIVIGGGAVAFYINKKGKFQLDEKNLEELIKKMPKGCGLRLFHSYTGTSDIKHFHRSPKTYHKREDRHLGKYDHGGKENFFPDFE